MWQVQQNGFGTYTVSSGPRVTDPAYGAIGNGVADDAAAFTRAMAGSGDIDVPAGTYKIDTNVAAGSKAFNISPQAIFTGSGKVDMFRGFYKNQGRGVNAWRFPGRLTVGAEAFKHGFNSTNDGNSTFLTSLYGAYYLERAAQLLSVSDVGKYGAVFATRASMQSLAGMSGAETAAGYSSVALNDSTGAVWVGYLEGCMYNLGGTYLFGHEYAMKNFQTRVKNQPYDTVPVGSVIAIHGAGGGDGAYPAGTQANITANTCFINIARNAVDGVTQPTGEAGKWATGINFGANAIEGATGTSGYASAMKMAYGHAIEYYANNSGGFPVFAMYSTITDLAKKTTLLLANDNIQIRNANNKILFDVANQTAATSNYIQLLPSATGAVAMAALGDSAVINFIAAPKGSTGRFGVQYAATAASVPGNFTADFILEILANGVNYKIPCRTSNW